MTDERTPLLQACIDEVLAQRAVLEEHLNLLKKMNAELRIIRNVQKQHGAALAELQGKNGDCDDADDGLTPLPATPPALLAAGEQK